MVVHVLPKDRARVRFPLPAPKMTIEDLIYGKFEIKEPVILDLMESPTVLRLKKIAQAAISEEYYQFPGFSRFEHSVGVMLLLRKLGADLEEQVTGLLHDASHTAFSHLIDYVMYGHGLKEDYQDNRHEAYILNSEIPKILQKHHLNPERIASHKRDSLLEREIPELCADRVDYGLREIYHAVNAVAAINCAEHLSVEDGKIIFDSKEPAYIFATHFLARQRDHWGGAEPMLRWKMFGDMLKHAIDAKVITLDDFDQTDDYVFDKLKAANHPKINETLSTLKRRLNFTITDSNPTLVLTKKFRYVDPLYMENGKLQRLSEAEPKFKEFVELQRERNIKGIGVKFYG